MLFTRLFVITILVYCGVSNEDRRWRVGWRYLEPGEAPYLVSFKLRTSRVLGRNFYQHFCFGAIIAPIKIVSVAHCFAISSRKSRGAELKTRCNGFRSSMVAVAGHHSLGGVRHNARDHSQWREITDVRFPETFKYPDDDIAVVYVEYGFNYHYDVKSIAYASAKFTEHPANAIVIFTGYHFRKDKSGHFRWFQRISCGNDRMMSLSRCNSTHEGFTKKMICTRYNEYFFDIGSLYSGGPLISKNTGDPNEGPDGLLIGVACKSNIPKRSSVHTRISAYSDYIKRGQATKITGNVNFICLYILIFILCCM